ncbi:MAG: hypothetical protein IKI95_05440 [Clostridia bacterium]|nr:hypothetical protein [Clostridia bacterium]
MNLGPLLAILSLIGFWAFMEFFPRRPKYHFEDPKKLRLDAKITHILPIAEGSSKQRRIRTSVIFDDGFVYSACIDSRSGLFTISASKEEQLEVANRAIKKHSVVVKKYATESSSFSDLSTLEKESEFETWIDYCKSNLEGCEEEIKLREEENNKSDTPEHIIKNQQ